MTEKYDQMVDEARQAAAEHYLRYPPGLVEEMVAELAAARERIAELEHAVILFYSLYDAVMTDDDGQTRAQLKRLKARLDQAKKL